MKKIVIAGVGYVGLVSAVCLAENGYNVICVDVNNSKIEMLKNGKSPIYEPKIEELLAKNKTKLQFATNGEEHYKNADIIFITVGTPNNKDNTVNLNYVYTIVEQIAQNAEKNCIIVVKSTVPVGTNDIIQHKVDKMCKPGIKIEVVSNPEFLSQGTAVENGLHPSRIILGVESEQAEEQMKEIYINFDTQILTTTRINSELIKYASNSFLALKVSYINEIANLCERVGADVNAVKTGMGLDSRIGNQYLEPGIGYGGSCLPKDTNALVSFAKSNNCNLKIIKSVISTNKNQNIILIQKLKKYYKDFKNLNIAILGATFKPNTDDLREAPSVKNIKYLLNKKANIKIFEKVGKEKLQDVFGDKLKYYDTIEQTIENADVCLIFTQWKEIKEIDLKIFEKNMKTPIIIDGRNCFEIDKIKKYNILYESIVRPTVNSQIKIGDK